MCVYLQSRWRAHGFFEFAAVTDEAELQKYSRRRPPPGHTFELFLENHLGLESMGHNASQHTPNLTDAPLAKRPSYLALPPAKHGDSNARDPRWPGWCQSSTFPPCRWVWTAAPYGFDLHPLKGWRCWASSRVLISHVFISSGRAFVQTLARLLKVPSPSYWVARVLYTPWMEISHTLCATLPSTVCGFSFSCVFWRANILILMEFHLPFFFFSVLISP